MTRRRLLQGAAAFAFQSRTVELLQALAAHGPGAPEDEGYWSQVRSAFTVEDSFLYLNHGGVCPSSDRVLQAAVSRMRVADHAPAYYLFRKQEHEMEGVRTRLAKLFGCDREEIAITPNASYGLFTCIMGTAAKTGELLLTTDHDYPRVLTALDQRARRDGVRVLQAEMPAVPRSVQEMVEPFSKFSHLDVKLVAIPRVGFLNGTEFPANEIQAAFAHSPKFLVDGAHSVGQLDDTASTLHCDYYACCLHKWILGPTGTGFLFVRRPSIQALWPLNPAESSLDNDIRKFEQFGTRVTGIPLAITEALDAHEAIGTASKAARLDYLRHYWTSRLRDVRGIRFYSPLEAPLGRCLVTLGIENVPPISLANWLFEKHRIFVTTAMRGDIQGIRVSPQIFTSPVELDRLVAALRQAAAKGLE